MIGRRRFLKLMGVTSAAAPMAAKAAAEKEAMTLAGIGVGDSPISGDPNGMPGIGWHDEANYVRAASHIQMFGLPEHVVEATRERARYVSWLDPDIACKRSWSLSVKVMTQRERNYERLVGTYRSFGWQKQAQDAFQKVSGFRWPW